MRTKAGSEFESGLVSIVELHIEPEKCVRRMRGKRVLIVRINMKEKSMETEHGHCGPRPLR